MIKDKKLKKKNLGKQKIINTSIKLIWFTVAAIMIIGLITPLFLGILQFFNIQY